MRKLLAFLCVGCIICSFASCGIINDWLDYFDESSSRVIHSNSSSEDDSEEDISSSIELPPSAGVNQTYSYISLADKPYDGFWCLDETEPWGVREHTYIYSNCRVTISPLQAVIEVGQSFYVLVSSSVDADLEYTVENMLSADNARSIIEDKKVTITEKGQYILKIKSDTLPHTTYHCFITVVER